MNLHLQAQLTAEDYAAAERLHRGNALPAIFFAVIAASVIGGLLFADISDPSAWTGAVLILLFLAWVLRRSLRRATASQTGRNFVLHKAQHPPFSVHLTDVAMTTRSTGRDEKMVSWTTYRRWKGDDHLLLAYSSSSLYAIFPRRWFACDAEFSAFKDLLARVIGHAGRLRKP